MLFGSVRPFEDHSLCENPCGKAIVTFICDSKTKFSWDLLPTV